MSKKEKKEILEKERKFTKQQIDQMRISSVEKDLIRSKWGHDILKTEKEICKILNRKENL